jgi:N,N'-diacetyllegionaminate synthase
MRSEILIGNRRIGKNNPCFIIAEAGVNHNGELEKALELVSIAKKSGADAVKFQLFNAAEQVSKHTVNAPYQRKGSGKQTMVEMAKSYDLPWNKHKEIADYCKNIGIMYMCSAFDPRAVDYLLTDLKGSCIKVGSGELTNYPLLQYMSETGKPIILSTGMCTLDDVTGAVDCIQSNGSSPLILLHCVSNYPAEEKDINIKAMNTLEKEFQIPVGYSDHTEGDSASIAAIAMGACVIEKHFTIDKSLPGPDHAMSLEPIELEAFVNVIRKTETILGDGIKKPTLEEEDMKIYARRSVVSSKPIQKADKIDSSNITLKRPATGIDPRSIDKIIGKRVIVDIPADQPITWDMIQ